MRHSHSGPLSWFVLLPLPGEPVPSLLGSEEKSTYLPGVGEVFPKLPISAGGTDLSMLCAPALQHMTPASCTRVCLPLKTLGHKCLQARVTLSFSSHSGMKAEISWLSV